MTLKTGLGCIFRRILNPANFPPKFEGQSGQKVVEYIFPCSGKSAWISQKCIFSLTRPSGPGWSSSRNVRLSVVVMSSPHVFYFFRRKSWNGRKVWSTEFGKHWFKKRNCCQKYLSYNCACFYGRCMDRFKKLIYFLFYNFLKFLSLCRIHPQKVPPMEELSHCFRFSIA